MTDEEHAGQVRAIFDEVSALADDYDADDYYVERAGDDATADVHGVLEWGWPAATVDISDRLDDLRDRITPESTAVGSNTRVVDQPEPLTIRSRLVLEYEFDDCGSRGGTSPMGDYFSSVPSPDDDSLSTATPFNITPADFGGAVDAFSVDNDDYSTDNVSHTAGGIGFDGTLTFDDGTSDPLQPLNPGATYPSITPDGIIGAMPDAGYRVVSKSSNRVVFEVEDPDETVFDCLPARVAPLVDVTYTHMTEARLRIEVTW